MSNEIYATIRLREIAEGLSPEDIRRKSQEKARDYKQQLDELYGGEEAPLNKVPKTFLGMSDDEIVVNKDMFEELGLL